MTNRREILKCGTSFAARDSRRLFGRLKQSPHGCGAVRWFFFKSKLQVHQCNLLFKNGNYSSTDFANQLHSCSSCYCCCCCLKVRAYTAITFNSLLGRPSIGSHTLVMARELHASSIYLGAREYKSKRSLPNLGNPFQKWVSHSV